MTETTQMTYPDVALNPELDRDALRARFVATGRAHIADILTPEAASRFYACLTQELPWRLAYNDGPEAKELTRERLESMDFQQQRQLETEIIQRAMRQFQYAYSNYPVAQTLNDPAEPKYYVHDVLRFLNEGTFQSFLRDITGLEGRLYADGHATCFQSGHFLTIHDDRDGSERRAIAYVFNMTPNWRPDCGATLQFFDDDLNIVESFAPTYNALNIFRVPQAHAVSFVPAYATSGRFGMTGWFHRAG
jgi:Rps23 Pro-64 3,4-dihydroxylase Tpa1-like proline 4-hydroxylase